MSMEPPLLESVVRKRGNRPIVVRISMVGHIKTPHAGVEYS